MTLLKIVPLQYCARVPYIYIFNRLTSFYGIWYEYYDFMSRRKVEF